MRQNDQHGSRDNLQQSREAALRAKRYCRTRLLVILITMLGYFCAPLSMIYALPGIAQPNSQSPYNKRCPDTPIGESAEPSPYDSLVDDLFVRDIGNLNRPAGADLVTPAEAPPGANDLHRLIYRPPRAV